MTDNLPTGRWDRDRERTDGALYAAAGARRKPPKPFQLPWAHRFSQWAVDRICEEVAQGRSLSRLCIEEPWLPTYTTVMRWKAENEAFAAAYEEARRARADLMAHEIVELADNSLDHEKTKLQISARQWLAGKMNRDVYGDVKQVSATLDARLQTTGSINVKNLTMDEIHAMEALLMKTIEGEVVGRGEETDEDEYFEDDQVPAGLAGGHLG